MYKELHANYKEVIRVYKIFPGLVPGKTLAKDLVKKQTVSSKNLSNKSGRKELLRIDNKLNDTENNYV